MTVPEGTLWRSRIDGSERLQLTNAPMFAILPRWSPDGKQIVFSAGQIGKPWKIFLVSAQGGAAQELLSENLSEMDPTWSPDGKRIAFGRLAFAEAKISKFWTCRRTSFPSCPGPRPTSVHAGHPMAAFWWRSRATRESWRSSISRRKNGPTG